LAADRSKVIDGRASQVRGQDFGNVLNIYFFVGFERKTCEERGFFEKGYKELIQGILK
jgi:hypothetical protein